MTPKYDVSLQRREAPYKSNLPVINLNTREVKCLLASVLYKLDYL